MVHGLVLNTKIICDKKYKSWNLSLCPLVLTQHPVLEHPQPTFSPQCERPSFIRIQSDRQNGSSAHCALCSSLYFSLPTDAHCTVLLWKCDSWQIKGLDSSAHFYVWLVRRQLWRRNILDCILLVQYWHLACPCARLKGIWGSGGIGVFSLTFWSRNFTFKF